MKKILAFAGSNSSNSINKSLLKMVSSFISDSEVELIDLRDYKAAVYSIDDEQTTGFPQTMVDLHTKMAEADGYLISIPEHNGSMPAVFKNTLDWQSRMERKVFNNKPTVFLCATPGRRAGASVLSHISTIMPHQGAELIGVHGVGGFHSKAENGVLNSPDDVEAIKSLLKELEEKL